MKNARRGRARAFTLIELLVVMSIVAVLLSIAVPRYVRQADRAREAALRANLKELRRALDHFYADTGAYPGQLSELVDRRYLRVIPVDPMTERHDTWIASTREAQADTGRGRPIIDEVRSGAPGHASDGTSFRSW